MEKLPPLDDDLLALLESERDAPLVPPERRSQLLARLERSATVVGAATAVGATAVGVGAALGKLSWAERLFRASAGAKLMLGATFVAGAVVGGATTSTFRSPPNTPTGSSSPAPLTTPLTPTTPEAPALPSMPPPSQPSAPDTPAAAPSGQASSTTAATPLSPKAQLEAERTWLERARAALARGAHADALQALREHERRFPRGVLTEEREVLAIRALVAGGEHSAARQRLHTFKAKHPNSIFLPRLEASLTTP